uniref:Ground-like domain-containing protein n=1 Tax=Strongyloides venezuelensis TaxID=75913 RepID=A0A0K0FII2_STRVS
MLSTISFISSQFLGAGGGSSCCCGCSSPQPSFCGCSQPVVCPPPQPCPPQRPPCPPPPIAICPRPAPIYINPSCQNCPNSPSSEYRTGYIVLRSNKIFKNEDNQEDEGEEKLISHKDMPLHDNLTFNDENKNVIDKKCNSEEMKNIILQNIIPSDALKSKHAIYEAIIEKYENPIINVICSESSFTYLVIGIQKFCEFQKDGVICFIYQNP